MGSASISLKTLAILPLHWPIAQVGTCERRRAYATLFPALPGYVPGRHRRETHGPDGVNGHRVLEWVRLANPGEALQGHILALV